MKFILFLFLGICFQFRAQESKNIVFLDNWHDESLLTSSTKVRYNGCWGFVFNNNEYAVIGSTEGTHVFEVSSENKLIERGFVRGAFSSAQVVHREFKNYGHYLYSICDEGNSTLQIIDLSYLPDSVHLVSEFSEEVGRAHNLFVDTANALLYLFKVTPILNNQPQTPHAMRVFSLANPEQPALLYSGPNDIVEVHDGYVRNNNAILNCGVDGLRRYNFSNPSNPVFTQTMPFYQEQGYNHQGWLNPAGDVYIFADETTGKKLKKCRVYPDGNIQIMSYFGTAFQEGSIPHNIMLDDQFAFVAYYNYGLRVYDYTKTPVEQVAFYDTYPDESINKMNGAWGVYSDLPSQRIIISDRHYGLFLFDFDRSVFKNRTSETFQIYPNPIAEGDNLTFFLNSSYDGKAKISLFDLLGNKIYESQVEDFNSFKVAMNVASGSYQLKIQYEKNNEWVEESFPVVVY